MSITSMGYFSRIADQSFITARTGERFFLFSGVWSRPYVIPDEATEARLRRKMLIYLRSVLLPIFCAPFALMILIAAISVITWNGAKQDRYAPPFEDVSKQVETTHQTTIQKEPTSSSELSRPAVEEGSVRDDLYFIAVLAILAIVVELGRRLLFRNELKQMRRMPTRIGIRDYYRPMSKRNSYAFLILALLFFGGMASQQTFEWLNRLSGEGVELETFTSLIFLTMFWMLALVPGDQIFLKISDRHQDLGPNDVLHRKV